MNFRHLAINRIAYLKLAAIAGFFLMVAFSTFFLWNFFTAPDTLNQEIKNFQKGGEQALSDLTTLPSVNLTEEEESYTIEDTLSEGIEITYPNQVEDAESIEANKPKTKVSLPKDYTKPIEIKLDNERTITIQDENNQGYTADTLSAEMTNDQLQISNQSLFSKIFPKKVESTQSYLRYQNDRKTLLYSYQRDRATGERKLKHWTFYEEGTGEEKESYKVENATLKKNENGDVELFFQTEQDLKNQAAAKEVDPSLMDRAMRTLEKEGVNQNQNPDLLIPKPYYYDKDGNYSEANWQIEGNKIILEINTVKDKYPLALDPTLSFTAPGIANGGQVINGETASSSVSNFGYKVETGDFNADGKTDLAVGATYSISSNTGKVYIFYNDGRIASSAAVADVVLTGQLTGDKFGMFMAAGDLDSDGKTDLVVTAKDYNFGIGRIYIFYNGSISTKSASAANVIIDGDTYTGSSVATADVNSDGRIDLLIGSYQYSGSTGRAYVIYNDGSYPSAISGADVTITGQASGNQFGVGITIGDLNSDGRVDFVVAAPNYSTFTGRAYVFYNDGSIPTTAATADAIITGEGTNNFFSGYESLSEAMTTGDFNADGKTDLAIGAPNNGGAGSLYIFYGGSIITENASGADIKITGTTSADDFGLMTEVGDMNSDGRVDLIVSAFSRNASQGAVYIFYNDGSIPTTAATADVIIDGEGAISFGGTLAVGDLNSDSRVDLVIGQSSLDSIEGRVYIFYSQNGVLNTGKSIARQGAGDLFGISMVSGDFNSDGRIDLAAGAAGYSTGAYTGRTYIFYNDGSIPTTAASADVIITGNAGNDYFGWALAAGDMNADSKIDLVVSAKGYSTNTGRTYIFYNDGSIPTTAATADVTITGNATSDEFGISLATGDTNADGKTDLIVGASGHSSFTGRVYIFNNDGSIPTTAATADVTITGNATGDRFGHSVVTGDLNSDGRDDLAVGAWNYSSITGRVYIFHNDGSIPTTAATADVTITGAATNNYFGYSLATGDLNSDGRVDLLVGARGDFELSEIGRAYIFYNDGSIPTTAGTADKQIDATLDLFTVAAGDINNDGRSDVLIGSDAAYFFYNDGSYPSDTVSADITFSGTIFSIADFNSDGKKDVFVGVSSDEKIYLLEGRDNYSWTLQQQPLGTSRISGLSGEELKITGDNSSFFGVSLAVGDFNSDGKSDLVVGASSVSKLYIFYNDGEYSSGASSADFIIGSDVSGQFFGSVLIVDDFNADNRADIVAATGIFGDGTVYVFYNDGSIPINTNSADAVIYGEDSSNLGVSLASGDMNSDGKTDLIIGAYLYSATDTGRTYIFYNGSITTENASGADIIITGNAANDTFGSSVVVGDLNADGSKDIAIGASGYSTFTGRVYIFYNDGSIPTTAATADVTITGGAINNNFGHALSVGDLNADSRSDLIVGAYLYSSTTGRAYVFYNDGSIPTTAATADVVITGEATNNSFGYTITTGDINADGKVDLIVSSNAYSSNTGRTYIFYNGSITTENASGADIIITGETGSAFGISLICFDMNADGRLDLVVGGPYASSNKGRVYMYTFNDAVTSGGATSNYFGSALTSGDYNNDGKVDLAVGAYGYSTSTGRAYIFYGGSALDVSTSTADITITGNATSDSFGTSLSSGDLNADGKIDLVIGASGYSTNTGRAYIFYNDGSIPTTAATADVTITGAATNNYFGSALTVGDLNADGETDLAVGAYGHSTNTGRVYVFYNGSIITESASGADVIITGSASTTFGTALSAGDINADGKTDLVVGRANKAFLFYNDGSYPALDTSADVTIDAGGGNNFGLQVAVGDLNADGRKDVVVSDDGYSSNTGRAYIFYNDGSYPVTPDTADVILTGASSSDRFGNFLYPGDFNADSKVDLAVGAYGYSSNTGRAYIFYNDGSLPAAADSADKIYTGSGSDYFGSTLVAADFNTDGITDLAVGAYNYSSGTGKVYTFITEIKSPSNGTYNMIQTPDGNEITASVKGGTVKIKGGTIQVK